MDFSAFDTRKLDEYAACAKEQWRKTEAYKEYEKKSAERSKETESDMARGLMQLFAEFAAKAIEICCGR